ncbi:C2H2 type zinc finger domain protein [Apiospora marii]|uniref:C2H2 type zinc finger domain protein n=1 Tax=Apiospora marii TaxID=335849 RepID=A0ABR1RKK8_9PEZI
MLPSHALQQCSLADPMELWPALSLIPSYQLDQDCYAYSPFPRPMAETQPIDYSIRDMEVSTTMHIHIDTRTEAPACVFQSNISPKVSINKAQWRRNSLQEAQGRHEIKEDAGEDQIPLFNITKSLHVCNFLGCHARFKRREHLRRHKKTKHGLGPKVSCELCDKEFNRRDNRVKWGVVRLRLYHIN